MPYEPLRFKPGSYGEDSAPSPVNYDVLVTFPSFTNCINNSIILEADLPNEFLGSNPIRAYALIQNNGEYDVTLTLGSEDFCNFGQGMILKPSGNYEITSSNLYRGALSAIAEFPCELFYVECVS